MDEALTVGTAAALWGLLPIAGAHPEVRRWCGIPRAAAAASSRAAHQALRDEGAAARLLGCLEDVGGEAGDAAAALLERAYKVRPWRRTRR